MVFKTAKGMFLLQRNYRDAFNLDVFLEKYIEECFDKYMYIVGDISSTILRLKGFDNDPKSSNYYGFIDDYLDLSCAFGCPFYVLKRIRNKEEYEKHERNNTPIMVEEPRIEIKTIEKENFDKDSLVLKSSPRGRVRIHIDSSKLNVIPKGEVPADIKELIEVEGQASLKPNKPAEPVVETQTYVSSSPDFDPSKKEQNKRNRDNQVNKNNNNNQNNANKKNNKNKKKKNNNSDKK